MLERVCHLGQESHPGLSPTQDLDDHGVSGSRRVADGGFGQTVQGAAEALNQKSQFWKVLRSKSAVL